MHCRRRDQKTWSTEIKKNKNKLKKKKRIEPRDLRDNIKRYNIGITGIPEGEKRETESEKVSENPMTNFPLDI